MNLPKATFDVDNISSLSSTPNATEGLTAAQLQALFDKTGGDIKTYINDILLDSFLDAFYPIGTIYETTSTDLDTTTKMGTHFGGTWEVYGSGTVTVCKSADTEFDTIGETGGAKTHTLAVTEMPSHRHTVQGYYGGANGLNAITSNNSTGGAGGTITTDTVINLTGGGLAHNNLQPYIVVYRYRRTA